MFPPPAEFAAKASIKSLAEYEKLWKEAADDIEGFWGRLAGELHWFQPYSKVLEWNEPFAKWFVGGKTNASYNCLDAHLQSATRNKAAIIWEGEPGDERTLTYQELHHEVCKFANVLKKLGMKQGDRGFDLHADDARAGDRDAGVCADWRGAFGDFRRLFQRSDCRAE